MGSRKNRERAEAGLIWRDGRLVRKEDWYKTHPTAEMKAEQQATVDKAVAEHFRQKKLESQGILIVKDGKVLDPKDTSAVLAEAEPYYCTKCKVTHRSGTKVHMEHHKFASQITVV